MEKEGTPDISKELPYDLRQVYAVDLLGEHLKDIARARKADNYSTYLKCLRDLWVISQHKFKNKKVKIKQGEKEQEVTTKEHYDLLMQNVAALANKYPNEFLGHTQDATACALIEDALNSIEMFLYDKIQEAGMFGASRHIPGL